MLRRPLRFVNSLPIVAALLLIASTVGVSVQAADPPRGFVDRVFKDADGEHKYVLFVPENYSPDEKWPVVLFLHGAYERGEDGRKQVEVGIGPYVRARSKTCPFFVVFPQARSRSGVEIKQTWSPDAPDGRVALQILDSVEQEFRIDAKRRILSGWSMGGYGVWQQAAADPGRWSALVPISCGGDVELAPKVKNLPVWAFHGVNDETVKPAESRAFVTALKSAGGKPRFSEIADVDHYAYKVAYDNDALYQWMLNPALDGIEATLTARPGVRTPSAAYENEPFRPAVVVPGALALRIGSDALKAVSYSIPDAMPRELLSGRIPNIYDSVTTSGRRFSVTFSGITYSGQLHRANLETTSNGELKLELALANLHLQIGGATVSGSGRSAVTGPMSIVIGHQRPVWLTMLTVPHVEKGEVKLWLRSVGFTIPNDNWSVSPPANIRVSGFGMTRERVRSGLVGGLHDSKGRIEAEVRAVVPTILKRIEAELDLALLGNSVGDFWPLPVYKPRLRVFAEEVQVDENGVTLAMGVMAAAIDPDKAPAAPRRVKPAGISLKDTSRGRDLRLHVAAGTLTPLTDLLIQADVARIHVNDIPGDAFAPFVDRDVLSNAIPDLKQLPADAQIWSELILARPLHVNGNNPSGAPGAAADLRFELPTVIISTAIRTNRQQKAWQPYAEMQFTVSQDAQAGMLASGFVKRYSQLDWKGSPLIAGTARFSNEYTPNDSQIDNEAITALFSQCWQNWIGSGPVSRRQVDDVALGKSVLRLSSAGWENGRLYMGYSPPGIRLTNGADEPLVYESKGPYSTWGGPFTLPPGDSHEFSDPYPILFRRRIDGRYRMFTLHVGTHSEFRVPLAGGPPQLFKAREPQSDEPAATEVGDSE